jgi:lysophospholipase L1-like esterase
MAQPVQFFSAALVRLLMTIADLRIRFFCFVAMLLAAASCRVDARGGLVVSGRGPGGGQAGAFGSDGPFASGYASGLGGGQALSPGEGRGPNGGVTDGTGGGSVSGVGGGSGGGGAPPPPDAGAPPDAGTVTTGAPTCVRLMPLGDSITLGVNGGYRNLLWTDITGLSCGLNYVGSQNDPYCEAPDHDHEGHPGYTIGDLAGGVDVWIAAAQPDVVLLMAGTNDIAWFTNFDATEIGMEHAALLDQVIADAPNAIVVVASIPPITSELIPPNGVDRAQLGRDLNVQIQNNVLVRQAAGLKVYFADVYSALSLSDLMDGVHPDQPGDDKIAQVWFQVLQPLLSCAPPAPACGP